MTFSDVMNKMAELNFFIDEDQDELTTDDLLTAGFTIQALEKQVPKKAKKIKKYVSIDDDTFIIGKCPECGEGVNSDMNYCQNCGQKIEF